MEYGEEIAHPSTRSSSRERRESTTFYRYMSQAEAEAVESTGLLRGGRPGNHYWTDTRYTTAREAKAYLALEYHPEIRTRFRITNDPGLLKNGTRVQPDNQEPGGGREWMSEDPVEVEVIDVDNLE